MTGMEEAMNAHNLRGEMSLTSATLKTARKLQDDLRWIP